MLNKTGLCFFKVLLHNSLPPYGGDQQPGKWGQQMDGLGIDKVITDWIN